MKIKYIQNKKINKKDVNNFLKLSKSKYQYTNNGPVKQLLEETIENMIGARDHGKRVLCVANGTNALHVLVYHFERKMNKKLRWLSQAFTFPSCVVGEMNTEVIDFNSKNEIDINQRLEFDGIIITNLFGTITKFDESQLKDKIIIYDNASSFLGTDEDGVNICLKGDAAFSSLHHTKTFGFGEGGFIVIPEEDYEIIKSLCGFGFAGNREYKSKSSNFKMSEISAAYILQHIKNYDIDKHLQNQEYFVKLLNDVKGVSLFNYRESVFYGNLPLIFDFDISVDIFRQYGIEANKYYLPLSPLQNSTSLYNKIINLPLHCDMNKKEIEYIVKIIKKVVKNASIS